MRLLKQMILCSLVLLIFKNLNAQPEKQNVILILADDLGYGDLGCYGQQKIKTPNIDKLAEEGMKFTNFYSGATVCAPSRASLLTGKHNGHGSVRGNQPFPQQLGNEPTIASILKQNGYATAVIGKWGVGHPQPVGDPQRCGFDYSFGYLNMWHAHNFFPEFLYENTQKFVLPGNKLLPINQWSNNSWVGSKENAPEGYGEAAVKKVYVPDLMEERMLSFISSQKQQPFFIFYTPTIPHANNEIKGNGMEVPDYGIYKNENWPDVEKGFAAAITRLDATVGNLVAHLKKTGLDKNTLIIFTSDNGPHSEGGHSPVFFNSNGGTRGKKRDLYDGGIKVPMIAWSPSYIKPAVTPEVFAQYDFLATISQLTSSKFENNTDGLSFAPLLSNQGKQQQHKYLYWEFYEEGGKQCVISFPWKLIKLNTTTFSENGKWELFNLANDPIEKKNVASENPKLVKKLSGYMQKAHVPHPNMSIDKVRPEQTGKT
jgi:arylsulfatase A-like enzyme